MADRATFPRSISCQLARLQGIITPPRLFSDLAGARIFLLIQVKKDYVERRHGSGVMIKSLSVVAYLD